MTADEVSEIIGNMSSSQDTIKPQLGPRSVAIPYFRSRLEQFLVGVDIEIETNTGGAGFVTYCKRRWTWNTSSEFDDGTFSDNASFKNGNLQITIK